MFPFGRDLLAIYLQDHLAGATLGLELARRAASENRETSLGETLASVRDEIEQDRETLQAIMRQLGVAADRLKNGVAWTAEKAARLKLNGRIASYSPLSPVVELDSLLSGVNGKRGVWRALRRLADEDPRLDPAQLDELIARADRQLDALWAAHAQAAEAAFTTAR